MGDLNFRLEVDPTDLSPEEIVSLVSRQEFGQLLAKDQLTIARTNGEAFSELNETLPTFPPSYKYKIGTSDYDLKAGVRHPDQYISQDKHGRDCHKYTTGQVRIAHTRKLESPSLD